MPDKEIFSRNKNKYDMDPMLVPFKRKKKENKKKETRQYTHSVENARSSHFQLTQHSYPLVNLQRFGSMTNWKQIGCEQKNRRQTLQRSDKLQP